MKVALRSKRIPIHPNIHDNESKNKKNAIILAFLIAFIGYAIVSFGIQKTNHGIYNVLVYFFSLFCFLYGVKHFIIHGLLISNSFLISFYFFLILNCYGFSALQRPKTLVDVYYFFFGPIIFFMTLQLLERYNIKLRSKRIRISYNMVCMVVLFVFCLLYLYIFRTKGIRLFSTHLKSQEQSLFVIQGISGWIDLLAWLSLMLSFSTDKKLLKSLMIVAPLGCTFLNASRTLTMRMLAFMVAYVLYSKGKKAGNSKTIYRACVYGVLAVVAFGVWGNYRERAAGWMTVSIGTALESSSKNDIFNWLYSYTAFNYDVLKQTVIEKSFPFRFKALFLPIIRIIGGTAAIGDYNKMISEEVGSIHGFNGSTFLCSSIYEMSFLYFVELILLAIIIASLAKVSKTLGFRGGYVYFIMASIMTVFGNYYLDINGLYAVILGIVICFFVKPSLQFDK